MAFIEPISRDASRPEFGLVSPVPGAAGYARPTWHILVAGTQIMTPKGAQAVDLIAIGDEVATRDHGMQPVLDVRVRRMGRQSLIAAPRQTPVSVGMGAFGNGLPVHTFWAHPMMIIATGSGERPPRCVKDMVGDSHVMRVFPDEVFYIALQLATEADLSVAGVWVGPQRGLPQDLSPGQA